MESSASGSEMAAEPSNSAHGPVSAMAAGAWNAKSRSAANSSFTGLGRLKFDTQGPP